MELKKAILRVFKMISKVRDSESIYRFMRFMPRTADCPALLYATDGTFFSVVALDDALVVPSALVDGHLLAKVARDAEELTLSADAYGQVRFTSPLTSYTLQSQEVADYPMFPCFPTFSSFILMVAWDDVKKVFHAAGKPKDAPEFAFVHFALDRVEATDKARFVRVDVACPYAGVIPIQAFQSFPSGPVNVAFTEENAFFAVGAEVRISPIFKNFPRTDGLIPVKASGIQVLASTLALINVAKQGQLIGELGLIHLAVKAGNIEVEAWGLDHVRKVYLGQVPVLHFFGEPGEARTLIDGKFLLDALVEIDTPNAKLCFSSDIAHPLRIESGAYQACIWQMAEASDERVL